MYVTDTKRLKKQINSKIFGSLVRLKKAKSENTKSIIKSTNHICNKNLIIVSDNEIELN